MILNMSSGTEYNEIMELIVKTHKYIYFHDLIMACTSAQAQTALALFGQTMPVSLADESCTLVHTYNKCE